MLLHYTCMLKCLLFVMVMCMTFSDKAQVEYKAVYELPHEKTNNVVSEQV